MTTHQGTDVVAIVLYSVFSVLVILTNGIVLIVIIMSRDLHLPTLWNIAHMAAWDFAFGLLWMIFVVPSKVLNAFAYAEDYKYASTVIIAFTSVQSLLNIVVMLVDRYIAVNHPLHYLRLMSPKRTALAAVITVLTNILRVIMASLTKDDVVYNNALGVVIPTTPNLKTYVTAGFVLMAGVIIVILLINISLVLRRNRPNAHRGRQRIGSQQLTCTMFISILVNIVCSIPLAIALNFEINEGNSVVFQAGVTCMLSNSLWNVFIYAATYRPFRDAFLKLFCPSIFRERARREVNLEFRMNRRNVFTVE